MTLEEARANIGRGVVYQASWPGAPLEEGVITSVGEKNVFVRYRSQHPGANGQATAPEDLSFPNVQE